jgi:hypothetical protein
LDKGGHAVFGAGPVDEAIGMDFNAEVRNFGPVPGLNFKPEWRIFVNGVELANQHVPSTPTTLYPTQSVTFRGGFRQEKFRRIANGTDILEVEVTISYDGPTGSYPTDCAKMRYENTLNAFFNLGNCTY